MFETPQELLMLAADNNQNTKLIIFADKHFFLER